LKEALSENAAAILAAAALHPHVEAVIRTIKLSPGKVEMINTTPDSLKKASGGEIEFFNTLKLVDLAMPKAGPHDHRKVDPYDTAFFAHLGHIISLQSLNIIATKRSDDWIAPIGKLTNLKTLRFTNNGKLSDAGLGQLAVLKNLESFSFVGTGMKGHAYAGFDGFTRLIKVSHRGSSIDDEGLKQLCDHLPNLESISLAHDRFTDTGAPHLAKLTKLKGLEIASKDATLNPLLPRPKGDKDAEGMKKQIPSNNVFVITPICPHSLANRPLVVEATNRIIFESPKQRDDLSLLVDGRLVAVLSDAARVHLRRAAFSLTLVSMTDQDFYDVLHQKMGWTGTSIGGEG